jgi:hypothetical protein
LTAGQGICLGKRSGQGFVFIKLLKNVFPLSIIEQKELKFTNRMNLDLHHLFVPKLASGFTRSRLKEARLHKA